MDCLESVKSEIKRLERLLVKYKQELGTLADCEGYRLEVSKVDCHFYYYKVRKVSGKEVAGEQRVRKYLGRADHPEVKRMQKYYYLRKVIPRLEKNLRALRRLERVYQTTDPNEMRGEFPFAYQFEEGAIFREAGVIDVRAWEEVLEKRRRGGRYKDRLKPGNEKTAESQLPPSNAFHPEQLRHTTACGIRVRSKSEVILSNAYFARSIPQEYEKEHRINGVLLRPDFTLWSAKDHREIIWEHFGLMNDSVYREQAVWKIGQYMKAGFYPGDNLIMTFDDADGNIDSLTIERILDVWF